MHVMPLLCAFSYFLRHWPVWIFQTFILPSWAPVASISESLLKHKHKTASSIIMKFSWAWYFKSLRIFPVVKFHTSINPSTEPVIKYWPSGENRAHSMFAFSPNCKTNVQFKRETRKDIKASWHVGHLSILTGQFPEFPVNFLIKLIHINFLRTHCTFDCQHQRWLLGRNKILTFISLFIKVGHFSSSCSRTAALPLKRSICVPGGKSPWCCCHLSAWPSKASSLDGGTTLTSPDRALAIAWRRFSLLWPSLYACIKIM